MAATKYRTEHVGDRGLREARERTGREVHRLAASPATTQRTQSVRLPIRKNAGATGYWKHVKTWNANL